MSSHRPRAQSRKFIAAALLVTGLAVVAGAYGAVAAPQVDSVKYLTSFGFFGRDAYVHAALERGYFKDENIDVTISGGTGSVTNTKLVAAGQVDFAPVDITAFVTIVASERPPAKLVSVVHQRGFFSIFALKESGITTLKDLEGKTIGDSAGSGSRTIFPLVAKRAGVDASKVSYRSVAPTALPALLGTKQVDAVGQVTVGKPLFVAGTGKEIVVIPYARYLPNLLGLGIVASDEMIKNKPDLVRRFLRALNKGLKYAIDNPGKTGAIINKHQPLTHYGIAAKELRIMKSYVQTPDTRKHGVGAIDPRRLASTISIVKNGFKISEPIAVSDVAALGFVATIPKKSGKK